MQILTHIRKCLPLPAWRYIHLLNRTALSSLAKLDGDSVLLHVLGNGAGGNPRSVILDYNDQLFMFNCGEGLQRLLPDYGFKSSKIDHFFTTSSSWSNFSGLSSLLMARYDAGIKDFSITGLNNEDIIKECIRFDTKLKRVKFHFDSKSDETFHFERLSIRPIILNEGGNNSSVIYLAEIAAQKGKICLEKCFKFRVPRQMVSDLENGNSVTLENGQTILPSDVCNPDQPEQCFMIFEPSSADFFQKLEAIGDVGDFLHRSQCIVHFTTDKALLNPQYKYFLKNLPKSHHLLITESNPSLCLYSSHRFQAQLNCIDPKLFPMLNEKLSLDSGLSRQQFSSDNVIFCPTGLSFKLRPQPQGGESPITFEKIPPIDLSKKENALIHKDGSTRDGLNEALELLHSKQTITKSSCDLLYPEFVFLGTASSVSLPIRNVSSILVNLSATESILLECGENTYGQLLRFYGPKQIDKMLKSIKAVFISHHHSDHHMGLVQLIERRHRAAGNKVMVIMPPMVSKFLHSKSMSFSSLNDLSSKYHYVVNRYFDESKGNVTRLLKSVSDVQLIPVSHCVYAYAVSVTTRSGFRFVFSGDTQPCDSLVQQGRNCDLLIHEATVEDGLVNFARTHFHTTMSEAIEVGRLMGAGFTILTHFSQRYGKLPLANVVNADDQSAARPVGLAFDNMRISPSQLNRLPLMTDALRCMYSKHLETLEYRSELYSRKYGKR